MRATEQRHHALLEGRTQDLRAWAVTKVAVVAALSIAAFILYLPWWLGLLHFTVNFHGWRALRLL